MTRHTYVDATTGRFKKWFAGQIAQHGDPPPLDDTLAWLGDEENYRDPLRALNNLCVGLREDSEPFMLQWIACTLIRALESERDFGRAAERFFNAMVRRCGVDDTEVNMYDKHTRVGTLHDLGLAKKETADA